jgi:hypothetical protein
MQLRSHSMGRSWILALLAAGGLVDGCHSATDPTPACFVEPPSGTNQSLLYKVSGPGACDNLGGTSVTPTPNGGTFAATIKFSLKGAKPNTLYYVQRAAEFPANATSADGSCQRAEGAPPWTAADGFTGPTWVAFPMPYTDQGPIKTLTTNAAGDGTLDFEFHAPTIATGTKFDVTMRLVDANVGDETGVTSEMRSGCMTVLPL